MDERNATAQRTGGAMQRGEELGGPPRWLGPLGRVPLLLGALCGVAVCLIGGLALTLLHGGAASSLPAPDATARRICTDLMRQDYTHLYSLLSSAKQADGTEAQFEASQRQLDIASGDATQCAVNISITGNGQAGGQFMLTRAVMGTTSGTATLVYVSGGWRLDAYDPAVI